MNNQDFNEPNATEEVSTGAAAAVETEEEKEVKYTQADIDRIISKTMEKAQNRYERKMKQMQSLSGLDEKERAIKEAEMKAQELEEKLKHYELMEQKAEVTKVLSSRGLSPSLIDVIALSDDVAQNQKTIDTLDTIFKQMIKAEVEKRVGNGNIPRQSNADLLTSMTKEKFDMLNDEDKMAYLMEHPDFM